MKDDRPPRNKPTSISQAEPPVAAASSAKATDSVTTPGLFAPIKAPAPTLPKGGGAIRGLGETFRVNPATGTCSFEVPLGLTPGRQGAAPSLTLGYDSGAGNGPFGLGWHLSAPAITRKTEKGIPQYGDSESTDIFLLSGFEELVPVPLAGGTPDDAYVVTRFRPRIEGAFARIERRWHKTTGAAHWRVTTRDNTTSVYGETASARLFNPSAPEQVFSWMLERTEDDRGNVVLYEYEEENLTGSSGEIYENSRREGRAPFTNRYLKRIRYGNTVPFDRSGQSCQLEAVFDYGEHDPVQPAPEPSPERSWLARQDPFSSYRAGFEIRTYRLCRRVLMFHRFPELGPEPTLVRSMDFGYDESPTLTRLVSISRRGYQRPTGSVGAYSAKDFPPLMLGYSTAGTQRDVNVLNPEQPRELSGPVLEQFHQWVDLDGDGLPGVLSQEGGALFYRRNEGQARLAPARRLARQPSLATAVVPQVVDLASDGRMELVRYAPPLAGYHERTDEDGWEPFVPFESHPRLDWNDPNLRFLDLNGDGLEDILLVGETTYTWYPSLGKRGFGPPRTFARGRDEELGPTAMFATLEQTIFLADMTGDGLRDMVRIANGDVSYWPNMGHGKFGAKVTMSGAPRFSSPDLFDARRIRLADVDGSGTTDILYIDGQDGVRVWFNQAGNGWSAEQKLHVYPDATARVEVIDLLGTGTGCLVWWSRQHSEIRYVDLCGGQKPHLLERISNNLGLETRLAYAPSTRFYLSDRAAGRPWVTRLPFPVHVVERVETYDHVSRVRRGSEYRYHHGYYDGQEREFRGFGRVEQVDTEAFSPYLGKGLFPEVEPQNGELPQPPVLTKTWFHTGAWREGDAVSRQFEQEYYALDEGAPPPLDTRLPEELTPEESRLACRALRGQMLRQEVYALDGSPEAPHPYSVVENSFSVRREQPGQGQTPAVFFVSPRESISLHYERYRDTNEQPDPRVTHSFTLEVDQYGTVRKSAAVAYPRRQVPSDADFAAQGLLAVTLTEVDVLNLDEDPSGYRLGIPLETRTWELRGLSAPDGVFSFEALATQVADADTRPRSYEQPPGELPDKRLIERVRIRYYDSTNLANPLPFGHADLLALPYESYQLALTTGQLAGTFNATEPRVTPATLAEGGYVQLPAQSDWWIPSGRQVFDPARFYLPTSFVDPWGTPASVEYDAYSLLVTRTEDALGNQVLIGNDYRTLSPVLITDPNGNRSAVRLDALGMVVATAVMGKVGSTDGDTLDDPTTTLEYDLFRFQVDGRPNFVRTRARERHQDPATRWQESISYSDGSGHELMRKVQAEPGPAPVLDSDGHLVIGPDGQPVFEDANQRWVGTGRTVFDNKGNPIKQYEPYFSRTVEYEEDEELVQWGVTPILRYDPLGRLVRTDFPNGTCTRVSFTPWTQATWDANDTVLDPGNPWYAARQAGAVPAHSEAEQRAAELAAEHAGTPTVVEVDPLGRPFLSIANLGSGKTVRTRTTYDIEGNPLVITDARGNDAMTHTFDVAGRKLHQKSIDAGERWMLMDVLGNPLLVWDSRAHRIRTSYDVLRRPAELWVRKDGGPAVLAERALYGEGHPDAAALNLRGRVYQQYDGAGLVTNEEFDFKGNLLASSRRLATDYKVQPNWSQSSEPELEAETFTSSTVYDALNRPISITKPDQSEIRQTYNEAGLLDAVDVRLREGAEWTAFVTDVDYNAKRQRERIVHGNGVFTEYTYDPLTFLLTGIETTRLSDGEVLQDLQYTYDPAGNIVELWDHAQETIFSNNQIAEPVSKYEYDALYRLTRADGREHAGQNADIQQDHNEFPLIDIPHPNDPQALRNYTESYQYDDVGNILAMVHQAGSGSWIRRYEVAADSNRLRSTSLPGDPEAMPYSATYSYDEHGNMRSMPHLVTIGWDFKDQMREADLGGGGKAHYVYDSIGERVRKLWEHGGIIEERIYLGGYEVYRRRGGPQAELMLERQTLHVMDDTRHVALVEINTVDASAPQQLPEQRLRYQLGNHLGSMMMELDESGLVISYEEYHPYGTTAYHAVHSGVEVSAKRYRYTGKERDEETGLYYYGARSYATWLGRWVSPDPKGVVDAPNLFVYVRNNPLKFTDPDGRDAIAFAEGVLIFMATDIAVPEPTDIAWPKWVAYGAMAAVAGATIYLLQDPDILAPAPPVPLPKPTSIPVPPVPVPVPVPLPKPTSIPVPPVPLPKPTSIPVPPVPVPVPPIPVPIPIPITKPQPISVSKPDPKSDPKKRPEPKDKPDKTVDPIQDLPKDKDDPNLDAFVIRGGVATPNQIQQGIAEHKSVPGLIGFSVQSAPGKTIEQLAAAGQFRNPQISVTTVRALLDAGVRIVPSPGRGYHNTAITPLELPPEKAKEISSTFRQMPNPAQVR